ncbi:MAG TPA: hypothetical protein VGV67_06200 [Solirubrobacteraceae bacterium]|nr:hypothetical protein [Solirubrobacteraceae bacterium]
MVDVLVGDDDQLEVLDAPAVRGERALERVECRTGVRAAVEKRQRVVLDEVRVDAADLERSRDRQAVDCGVGGARERRLRLCHRAEMRCGSTYAAVERRCAVTTG